MRAIMIDPFTRKVSEIDTDASLDDLYRLLDVDLITVVQLGAKHAMILDDEGRACMVQAGAPGKGFAKQRVFVENGQELLGEAAPGQRPEPGTGATGKDHGYEYERRITFVLRGAYWTIDAPRETTGAEAFMVHRPRWHDRASGSRQIALPRIHALFD